MSAAATSSPFPAPAKVGLKYKKALGDRKDQVADALKEIATAVGIDTVTWDSESDIGILLAQHEAEKNPKLEEFINGATNVGSSTQSLINSWKRGVEHQCKNADVKKAFADAWTTKKLQLRWTKDVEKAVEPGSIIEAKNGVSVGLKDGVVTLYMPFDSCDKTKHESVYLADLVTKHAAQANPGAKGLDVQQKKEYAYRGPQIEETLKKIATAAGLDSFTWDHETDVPELLAFYNANNALVNVGSGNFANNVISNCQSIIGNMERGLTHQFKDPMISEAFRDAVTKKQISIKMVKDCKTDVSKDQSAMTGRDYGAVQIKDGVITCYQNAADWGTSMHNTVKIENLL